MEKQAKRLSRYMALSLGGIGAVLLVGVCLCYGQPVTASTPVSATWSDSPEPEQVCLLPLLSDTDSITVFLPLVARNCRSYVFDDFSNPASGWDIGTFPYGTFYYDNGVCRIVSNEARRFIGDSPEWMVPDDAVIRVDAWIDNAPPDGQGFSPAVGLVFGLGFYPYQGKMYWVDWYEFRVYPRAQRYALIKWYEGGNASTPLVTGGSDAIFSDLKAVQKLEVRRSGNTMALVVNGTTLATITDSYSPYVGPRSVGVSGGDFYSVGFDNFEISASGCITNVNF